MFQTAMIIAIYLGLGAAVTLYGTGRVQLFDKPKPLKFRIAVVVLLVLTWPRTFKALAGW